MAGSNRKQIQKFLLQNCSLELELMDSKWNKEILFLYKDIALPQSYSISSTKHYTGLPAQVNQEATGLHRALPYAVPTNGTPQKLSLEFSTVILSKLEMSQINQSGGQKSSGMTYCQDHIRFVFLDKREEGISGSCLF